MGNVGDRVLPTSSRSTNDEMAHWLCGEIQVLTMEETGRILRISRSSVYQAADVVTSRCEGSGGDCSCPFPCFVRGWE